MRFADSFLVQPLGCSTPSAGFARQRAESPRFEAAPIKPSDPDPQNTAFVDVSADGAMVNHSNITLLDCSRGAYCARDFQIVGQDWLTKARFAIRAKLPPDTSSDQIEEILQACLPNASGGNQSPQGTLSKVLEKEDESQVETASYQRLLPFDQPVKIDFRILPQSSDRLRFGVEIKRKAS